MRHPLQLQDKLVECSQLDPCAFNALRGLPAISISSCLPVTQSMFQDSGCGERKELLWQPPAWTGKPRVTHKLSLSREKLQDEISSGPELGPLGGRVVHVQ